MQRVPVAIAATQLGTSAAAIYAVPTATTATIANCSFTNTSSNPVSITVYNVPSSGAPAAGNQVVSNYTLSPNQTYSPPQLIGLNMAAGATLQALAGTAAVVNAQGGAYQTTGS